jgi:hypothetical protein
LPWVRIDEEFPDHPKVVGAGPLGIAMQVAALCYCNRHLTDGFVPRSAARRLIDLDGLGVSADDVIKALLGVKMWSRVDGGYRIHDYEHYQPTRAQVLAERERNRLAGEKGGRARAAKRGVKQSASGPLSEPSSTTLANRQAPRYDRFTPADDLPAGSSEVLSTPPSEVLADRLADPQAKSKPVPVPVPISTVPPSAGRAATADNVTPIPTAQTFVAAYVNAYRGRTGHDPPSRVKGHLAKELARLIADGIPTEAIKAGFVQWFERDQHPSTLASFVEVEARGGQARASPTRSQRQEAQARQTYQEMMADAPGGMGTPRRPPQPELARPADHQADR